MNIFRIIMASIQIIVLLNYFSFNIFLKYITKRIPVNNDNEKLILSFGIRHHLRSYIFIGVFMLPFIKKVCEEYKYLFYEEMLEKEMERLSIKNTFNKVLHIPEEGDTEKMIELKTLLRNHDLRLKIKKIKNRRNPFRLIYNKK